MILVVMVKMVMDSDDGEDGAGDAAEVQFLAPPLQSSRVRGAMLVLLCYREEKRRSRKEELNKTDL